jgi:DNA polymerase-3 subunit gamma/tau
MSYLVSARRWRPQTFEDLVGQGHVSRTLANAIRADRVAHAFLFTGVRGVGKTTAARVLAKALNCENGPTGTPCNQCTNCREITAGSAVDVLEIDGASNTGVDDVREIIENVRYQAAKSRFKIYIIDEVHMLSNSAFNALLKTLEEPPAHVKFIFATTDPHKLPATVQSRCQRYDFRRIPLRLVVERLRHIAAADRIEISDRALFVLAREGEGSMRDAQSLLDQVVAAAAGPVSDDDVLAALGIADRALIYDVADALIGRDATRALELLDGVHQQGYDMRRLARDLLEHFRNLAVLKVSEGRLLPEIPEEEATALKKQMERIDTQDCDRAFRILQETDEEAGRSPYPKLVLEMALIKLATLPALLPIDDLLTRIEELETRLRRSPAAVGTQRASAPPPPRQTVRDAAPRQRSEPAPAEPPPAPEKVGRAAPKRPAASEAPPAVGQGGWSDFVHFVRGERPSLADHLRTCEMSRMEGSVLEIEAPAGFRHDYLVRRDHVVEVEDLAGRFFQRPLRVVVHPAAVRKATENSEASEAKTSTADLTTAALGDPVVRAAVEIFGGEVAEVRSRRSRRREEE